MKLIHTSDIHLDSPMTSKLGSSKARERKREILDTFRHIIDESRVIGATGVIIAGDLFDNDSVSVKTVDLVMGMIEAAKEVSFLYLPGNHEKNRVLSSGATLPKNLKIFGEDWTYFDFDGITVAGRSETSPDMFNTLELRDSRTNIVVLHGELRDRSDMDGKIGAKEISALPIDYLALGHYHSYRETKISDRCTAVYSGTPEGRGFDEIGDKGYVIVDASEYGVSSRFVKRSVRSLHIIPVDITGAEREIEIEDRVAYALSTIPGADLVRVQLVGEHSPELRRDTEALTKRFSPLHYFIEFKDETRLHISADEYKNDKSLKGEFIRLVLSKEGLTDNEKASIIECGIRALNGEEI